MLGAATQLYGVWGMDCRRAMRFTVKNALHRPRDSLPERNGALMFVQVMEAAGSVMATMVPREEFGSQVHARQEGEEEEGTNGR